MTSDHTPSLGGKSPSTLGQEPALSNDRLKPFLRRVRVFMIYAEHDGVHPYRVQDVLRRLKWPILWACRAMWRGHKVIVFEGLIPPSLVESGMFEYLLDNI